jgi:aminoglycoside 3-N-acetyltransferase
LPAPATQPARRLAEFSMAVPWRYVREMLHPVMRNGRVEIETFYVHVPYRGIGLDIDEGEALFDRVCAAGLAMQTADANGTPVTGLGMAAYYRLACAALRRDLYIGCIAAPTNLPYRT